MNVKLSTTAIGAFVLGAIGLILVGLVAFGSGHLFRTTQDYVLYFQGSVKGLTVGSPVSFRGVRVGQVKAMKLLVNSQSLDFSIPVIIEIDLTRMQLCCDEQGQLIPWERDPDPAIDDFINKGLRAKLDLQNLVTGQLMVDLDFYPDTPYRLIATDEKYHEIPTIQSPMQELLAEIEQIPFRQIANKTLKVLDELDAFLSTPELTGSVVALDHLLKVTKRLVDQVDSQFGDIAGNFNATLSETRSLVRQLDGQVEPLGEDARETILVARDTLLRVQDVMDNVNRMTGEESEVRIEVLRVLRETSEAMRSLRVLTQYLETHPESLLRGKPDSGGSP